MSVQTSITESAVLPVTLEAAWSNLSTCTFKFLGKVDAAEAKAGGSALLIGGTQKVVDGSGASATVKLTGFNHCKNLVGWTVVESDMPSQLAYSNCRISLRRVTEDQTTFVEWTSTFDHALTDTSIATVRRTVAEKLKAYKALLAAEPKDGPACSSSSSRFLSNEPPAALGLTRQLSLKSQELLSKFQELDKNGDGRLDISEFRVAVEALVGFGRLPDMAVNILLDEADLDDSADVDYNEFVAFIKKRESK